MAEVVAAALLAGLGFQTVGSNTLMQKLNRMAPSGGTAMRDSLLAGTKLILQLNQALSELGMEQNWNFVHILITDGQDSDSKNSLETTMLTMLQVGAHIPVDRCRTIIIGVDLRDNIQAARELIAITQFGLENCEIHEVGSVEISELFQRIQIKLGILKQVGVGVVQQGDRQAIIVAEQNRLVAQVSRKSFAVVFNLDVSGSMANDGRWDRVKSSVSAFLQQTPPTDLVAGICFNSSVMLLSNEPSSPQQRPALPAPSPKPHYEALPPLPMPVVRRDENQQSRTTHSSNESKRLGDQACVCVLL